VRYSSPRFFSLSYHIWKCDLGTNTKNRFLTIFRQILALLFSMRWRSVCKNLFSAHSARAEKKVLQKTSKSGAKWRKIRVFASLPKSQNQMGLLRVKISRLGPFNSSLQLITCSVFVQLEEWTGAAKAFVLHTGTRDSDHMLRQVTKPFKIYF
jgi:hypothetical protein